MKNIIISIMAIVMMTSSAMAMSPALDADGFKDYDSVEISVPAITEDTIVVDYNEVSDWDYFWGTTLNPANTGWNDFWFQCQDPTKTVGDCIGTVVVGLGATIVAPYAIVGATLIGIGTAAATIPAGATVLYFPALPVMVSTTLV